MTQAERRALWISRIKDYRASGERVATWCERHELKPRQLWYWIRTLKRGDEQEQAVNRPLWVPLHMDETTAAGAAPLLVKVGTASIEVRAGFDPSLLIDVVRALNALC